MVKRGVVTIRWKMQISFGVPIFQKSKENRVVGLPEGECFWALEVVIKAAATMQTFFYIEGRGILAFEGTCTAITDSREQEIGSGCATGLHWRIDRETFSSRKRGKSESALFIGNSIIPNWTE